MFRIELQLNRGAIDKNGLNDLRQWRNLPTVLTRYICFFQVDWPQLTGHIERQFRNSYVVLRKARRLKNNLDGLMRFLRQVGVSNPVGFLIPMAVNADVTRALTRWERQWQKDRVTR